MSDGIVPIDLPGTRTGTGIRRQPESNRCRVPLDLCEFCRRRPIETTAWVGGIHLKVCGNCAVICNDEDEAA